MITNIGKNLIGKYLVGQSTQYASHIAIGCGTKPITSATSYSNYATKTELDFEMERLQIISRSYIADKTTATITQFVVTAGGTQSIVFTAANSFIVGQVVAISDTAQVATASTAEGTTYPANGNFTITASTSTTFTATRNTSMTIASNSTVSSGGTVVGYINKISLIAELPIDNRYEITELGLWSDISNPIPSGIDSKNIFNFGRNSEVWQYKTGGTSPTTSTLTYAETALDSDNVLNNLNTTLMTSIKAVLTNSDNTFFNSTRIARFERPRFLDDCLIVGGDLSKFEMASSTTVPCSIDETVTNDYITISNINLGALDTNSTSDELVFAYSLISRYASATTLGTIESVNIMIEFNAGPESAKYHFKQRTSALSATNRYQTIKVSLGDTTYSTKSDGFLWKDVTSANIYASIQDSSGAQLSTYALALDGLNFTNKNNLNSSNYGLVSYVPIRNTSGTSILKNPNNPNLIEYRLVLGILGI
jgi:hypothetical protein